MTLEVGDVFLLRNFGFSGTQPHYHIVIHKTTEGEVIVVYTTTSLVATYRACRRDEIDLLSHLEPETYIEILPEHCPTIIKEKSAINCNKVDMQHEQIYINGADFKKYEESKIPQEVIQRVKAGIPHSSTVKQKILKALK